MPPQYRILPNKTDINRLFLSEAQDNQLLPVTSRRVPEGVHELCRAWGNNYHTHPLARKCEALAVSGLAGCGDQIDVIAPVEILKKIFKIPYSKARLSIAVQRVGQTLILNTGPDVDEGDGAIRTKKSQAKAKEKSLFVKFAMQSVRAEACDCPPANVEESSPPNMTSHSKSDGLSEFDDDLLKQQSHIGGWNYTVDDFVKNKSSGPTKSLNVGRGHSRQHFEGNDPRTSSSGHGTFSGVNLLEKSSLMGEQQRDPHYDPGNHKRPSSEGFLRVLFWQLEDVRMLLGSDLLLFSNDKHVAVSLHLWETARQVTPLMWLDIWLDNVMASVPELAICYHHNGIVQGYELLKTDDIFLLKGLSADGTSFFDRHVVQQNALSVLRFLQENCKQDLGTYWLFKNSGEDLVQLFDLSVISSNRTAGTKKDMGKESLPPSWIRGKGSCSLPLGILLYRLAHRLSFSQDPSDRYKCAIFFKNCLDLLGEHDHLFVRASAHEHFARLILKCHEELGSMLGPLLVEARNPDDSLSQQSALESPASMSNNGNPNTRALEACKQDTTFKLKPETSNIETSLTVFCESQDVLQREKEISDSSITVGRDVRRESAHSGSLKNSPSTASRADGSPTVQDQFDVHRADSPPSFSVVASVQARLTAVHHVSHAIKALRWQRQLQDVEGKAFTSESQVFGMNSYVHVVPVCVHGELDRIEYCDIRESEIGPFMESKLLQLVLLLAESYLALGLAYKNEKDISQALKATELACSVYASMPQHFGQYNSRSSYNQKSEWVPVLTSHSVSPNHRSSASQSFCQPFSCDSDSGRHIDKGLFWSRAWVLVGDTYAEYQKFEADNIPEKKYKDNEELLMPEEVIKEVKRLRKKLGQSRKGCSICSLTNCSCENDRANSSISASSSSSCATTSNHFRRQTKKLNPTKVDRRHTKSTSDADVEKRNMPLLNVNGERGSKDFSHESSAKPKLVKSSSVQNPDIISKEAESERGRNEVDVPNDVPKVSGKGHQVTGDIFSYIHATKSIGRRENLSAALQCYDAAILALTEVPLMLEERDLVLRKKGWAYNELGRMKLACGNTKDAEIDFNNAISAFKDAKDQTNVVLIYCNIGHGKRAAAESLVSQLDSVKATGLFEHVLEKLFDDAVSLYTEALQVYGLAKSGLKFLPDDVENEKRPLCNEVITQLAHTFLRLGMLLVRENKNARPIPRIITEPSDCETINSQPMHPVGITMTANDAIREAISLYESLGGLRAQELAFAQYQLACYHKTCCLAAVKSEGKKPNNSVLLQQSKRYLSLADRYWVKALRYYKWFSHPDMFLEILMQRSDLSIAVASAFNALQLLEVALSHLLDARHAQIFCAAIPSEPAQEYIQPSEPVHVKFVQKLQSLLKEMLIAVQNNQSVAAQKNSSICSKNLKNTDTGKKREAHKLDVLKLKEMYRLSLKSRTLDLQRIHELLLS
ncbi:hypothetical protein KP509_05G021900 [Ceratopteris richardii]|nr:hypothetical protein KP509_05G021900 [Ceratopteris richardii]